MLHGGDQEELNQLLLPRFCERPLGYNLRPHMGSNRAWAVAVAGSWLHAARPMRRQPCVQLDVRPCVRRAKEHVKGTRPTVLF